MPVAKPHHIIAIGASAGGMEEINTFFDHTRLDGVSYIIVQHLSADFKSRMVELLARHSKLEVIEAMEGMAVVNNKVYLIPSNMYMTIHHGNLHLTGKKKNGHPHLTINTFFESLADDCGDKAIAVILSGLGADGTEGAKAIKLAGGMVMARDPACTEFGSMPSNAIATGLVDFILEPSAMPSAIEEFIRHEEDLSILRKDDEGNMAAIIDLINQNSPLDFSDYKQATIIRRTKRRAAFTGFKTLGGYFDFLKNTPEEVEKLSKEFLISVTSFFRDKEAFEVIQNNVLPDILQHLAPDEELKLWVAGCATGEEAYSMAILIAEQRSGKHEGVVKIFATDIDSKALIFAGKGLYGKAIAKDIAPPLLEKYFTEEPDGYRVKPVIRKMVIFAKHDMVKNPPYCNMHFISCRNLLIYMAPILQKKIFTMLLFGLKMDAYLFLGTSENPLPILNDLQIIDKKWKVYKNLQSRKTVNVDAFMLPAYLDIKNTAPEVKPQYGSVNETHSLDEIILESLADSMGYFAACIDQDNLVVKSYGDTTKYLLQKHFTAHLPDLLNKPLAMAFSILKKEITKTYKTSFIHGIDAGSARHPGLLADLSISPLKVKGRQDLLLVIFKDGGKSAAGNEKNIASDQQSNLDQYLLNLEEELKELKEKLIASKEKLNASNENMQSFNEELISANEEMQSTNEEMQSVNEELHTINSDYQLKNKELAELNDDLNNYFRSNVNGQLFINNELLLVKFSPGTVKQINLLDSDIGRPLSNISTNIKFETIIDDVKKVLSEGVVITKEIETNDGKWYQIMTMPYVHFSDQRNNGAIITFNDITELKKVQLALNVSNRLLGLTIDSTAMGTWSIDIQTREFIPSTRLKELYGFHPEDTMSYEDALGQVNEEHKTMVAGFAEACIGRGTQYDVEYALRGFHDGKLRWVRGVGNTSHNNDGTPAYFTGVLQDITEQKLGEIRKNDFIAMVSHELKTPMTLIQTYTQILEEKAVSKDDQFGVSLFGKVMIQIKKVDKLINGFLNVSSFDVGKIYLNEEKFEMNTLINEIIDDILLSLPYHNILFHPCPILSATADRNKIGQVVNNLLSNAIKYSPNKNDIIVGLTQVDDMIEVSIADKGIGIKTKYLQKLFDRHYRVESLETKNISGFGLGLYLSAEIIQRHNGKIWVESKEGKGSTFFFTLPVQSAEV